MDKTENLVCVVVYDRLATIYSWLRAWQVAQHFGAQLAIIHNYDMSDGQPDATAVALTAQIEAFRIKPDYYIRRTNNYKRDLGAFQSVIHGERSLPDWDNLFWFADDLIPMRPDFLEPFVRKLQQPDVGIVTQCYEPVNPTSTVPHMRTVAFGIRREVAKRLVFPPAHGGKHWAAQLEWGDYNIAAQIEGLGLKVAVCHGGEINTPEYIHWTAFTNWMWDCSLQRDRAAEMMPIFEKQFHDVSKSPGPV